MASELYKAVDKFFNAEVWEPKEIKGKWHDAEDTANIVQHTVEQEEWEEKADVWLEKAGDIELLVAELIDSLRSSV